jgi:hypothetical protein
MSKDFGEAFLNQTHQLDKADDYRARRRRWDWLLSKVQDIDLNHREDQFVSDLLRKQDRQRDNFSLSEAQEEWLEAIANRG